MKVYVSWDEWYPFPFLYKEAGEFNPLKEIPEELYERHDRLVKELEAVIDEIGKYDV